MRPLSVLAIILASVGVVEGSRLALSASSAFASEKEKKEEPAIDPAATKNVDANPNANNVSSKGGTCLPVDLAKESGISAGEFRLLQALQDRRQSLDARESDILTREGIIKTADDLIGKKIANLQAVEANITKLLGQVDELEQQRIASLVRVYEKMKPKDAAKVMEGLSDEVILPIASKMKDQSLALILAKMNPVRARQVTVLLAQIDGASSADNSNAPQAEPQKMASNDAKKSGAKSALPANGASAQPNGAAPQAPQAPNTPNPASPNTPNANPQSAKAGGQASQAPQDPANSGAQNNKAKK